MKEVLEQYSRMTEAGLDRYLPAETCAQQKVFEACRYSLLAGGKHIRTALLLEFYRLCGGEVNDALPLPVRLK